MFATWFLLQQGKARRAGQEEEPEPDIPTDWTLLRFGTDYGSDRTAIAEEAYDGDFDVSITLPAGNVSTAANGIVIFGMTDALSTVGFGIRSGLGVYFTGTTGYSILSTKYGGFTGFLPSEAQVGDIFRFYRTGDQLKIELDGYLMATRTVTDTLRFFVTSRKTVSGKLFTFPFATPWLVESEYVEATPAILEEIA